MEITINQDQRLFVIGTHQGSSCLGFDVVYGHCMELAKRIIKLGILKPGQELPAISESEKGSTSQYQTYQHLLSIVAGHKLGTWFSYETPSTVRRVLERCREEGDSIRVFYGDTKTGRSWMCENDVIGRVGRSTGLLQIPLLIANGESSGGGILDNRIIRIVDLGTRSDLYRHSLFHVPEMEIRLASDDLVLKGYTHGVWVSNQEGKFENHANFTSFGKAAHWVAYMTGDSNEQPLS